MSQNENQTGEYILRLKPLSGWGWQVPPVQRLRLALKRLSRDFGLICTELRPESPPQSKPPPVASSRQQ
jgi:hypothetical protein